jgi:drug/metabolite transporter (DMT)-like permease
MTGISTSNFFEREIQMLQTILIVLLILFLLGGVGTLPTWSHSRNWGYGPSSLAGIALLVLIILLATGRV